MKQQTKNKLILALNSIIVLVLSFFFILGVITSVNKVKAKETSISDYYTAEMLEELKIGSVTDEPFDLRGKHLLFDLTDYELTVCVCAVVYPTPEEFVDDYGEITDLNFQLNDGVVTATILGDSFNNFTYEYFVIDGTEYVYLHLPNIPELEESGFILYDFERSWVLSGPIEIPDEPTVEPETPSDETTVEPEEKSGCGSFFEDVGVVVNELLKIEDTEPFATGMATIVLGGLLAFFALLGLIKK